MFACIVVARDGYLGSRGDAMVIQIREAEQLLENYTGLHLQKTSTAFSARPFIMPEMTTSVLREIAEKNKGYRTASLNDVLYLHYKGFRKIENLEAYTGLKVLWLEGNGIEKIEGLDAQVDMRSLYLQENCIEELSGLSQMTKLASLNLRQNCIECLEPGSLTGLGSLETLNLARNSLQTADDLAAVLECPSISVLDIQDNDIEDPAVLPDVLERLPGLRVLYLQGNPVVRKIKNYRKTVISRLPALRFLDDRPVFEEERLRCVAWARGLQEGGARGAAEAERAERARQGEEKREAEERRFQAFASMMKKGRDAEEERAREQAFLTSLEGDADEARARARTDGKAYDDGKSDPVGRRTIQEALQAAEEAGARVRAAGTSSAAGGGGDDIGTDIGTEGRTNTAVAESGSGSGSGSLHAAAADLRALSHSAVGPSGARVNPFNGEQAVPMSEETTQREARERRARAIAGGASLHGGAHSDAEAGALESKQADEHDHTGEDEEPEMKMKMGEDGVDLDESTPSSSRKPAQQVPGPRSAPTDTGPSLVEIMHGTTLRTGTGTGTGTAGVPDPVAASAPALVGTELAQQAEGALHGSAYDPSGLPEIDTMD